MNTAYIVHHVHIHEDGHEDTKLIGAYTSEQTAQAAIARLQCQPGFCDTPEGFTIDRYMLDHDHWREGYATEQFIPQTFRELLGWLLEAAPLDQVQPHFQTLFFAFGSETEDNRVAIDHVLLDQFINPHSRQTTIGFVLKDSRYALSTVMNYLESEPLPPPLQQQLPLLTEEEWSAATRMMTMILLACEHRVDTAQPT
jgi:hypothetical protein